jgi:hypothetical protein
VPAAGADVIAETILRATPSGFGLFEIRRVSTPADLLNAGPNYESSLCGGTAVLFALIRTGVF